MELQKHRISTNIGVDQNITVELKQNFDLLEILSLKFSQTDIYRSFCSDYGVVCGRITANNGFGIPNCRISIFVPIKDRDTTDPVISALYPYTSVSDRDENNYRYNLLPARKQHGGHVPTGTFPDQEDILTREEVLQVYHDYYNFTVKTNEAGDFMIWGVPLGQQTIHVDVDLSDMGCFSIRPYDFIRYGVSENKFDRFYNFKSDTDIDGLPQIIKFDKTIQVVPFWGNKDICQLGITRVDFDLSEKGIKIEPISLLLLSTVTDDDGDAVKRTGVIRRKSGYKCNLKTRKGQVEGVRFKTSKVIGSDGVSIYPELEYFDPGVIDEDGSAMVVIPMNMEYTYTNEFGEQEITNDPNKGIATTTTARFRVGLDVGNVSSFKGTEPAYYLIPNIREFNLNSSGQNDYAEYDENMLSSYVFSDVFEDYFRVLTPTTGTTLAPMTDAQRNHKRDLMLGVNNNDIPEDTFYKFIYGKVYTPSSFQGTHYEVSSLESFFGLSRRDAFLGIKEIRPNAEDDCPGSANYFPTNYGFRNRIKFNLIISVILLFIQFVFTVLVILFFEFLGKLLYDVGNALYSFYLGWPFDWRPFCGIGEQLMSSAYWIQDRGTKVLPLTIYPDCEECTQDATGIATDLSNVDNYCSIGEIKFKVFGIGNGWGNVYLIPVEINNSTVAGSSFLSGTTFADPTLSAADSCGTGHTLSNSASLMYLSNTVLNPGQIDEGDDDNSRFFIKAYPFNDTVNYYDSITVTTGTTVAITPFDARFNSGYIYNSLEFINNYDFTWHSDYNYFNNDIVPYTQTGNYNDYYVNPTGGTNQLYNWLNIYTASTNNATVVKIPTNKWKDLSGINYDEFGSSSGTMKRNGYKSTFNDGNSFVVFRVYDRTCLKNTNLLGTTMTIETGCAKYDKFYDEPKNSNYILWASGSTTYGDPHLPVFPTSELPGYHPKPGYTATTYNVGDYIELPSISGKPTGDYTIMANICASNNAQRMPRFSKWGCINPQYYDRKTKSGYSEIRDGVFTCIPVIHGDSNNMSFLKEWYNRKYVGTFFCGGVVNFSYIDNWLNGLLYMFKFDFRIKWDDPTIYDLNQRGSKFPRELVFYDVYQQKFYYRSTPYNPNTQKFTGQWDSGGFKGLIRPTTIYDVGVRDEFLYEICYDPRVDPTCSVIRDIGSTSYQDPAYVIEHVIDYRLDASNSKADVSDFFSKSENGANTKVLDGDITQLMSINNEAGIEAFDLDVPQYFNYNNEFMDPEDPTYRPYFGISGQWGPTPIDFKLDQDGRFVRLCLNNRLGDYTQKVPLYLWEKYGEGFGLSGGLSDQQRFVKNPNTIATMKLQRMFSIGSETGTTTNYVMADGEEEYLLKPMTKDHPTFQWTGNYGSSIERFEYIKDYAPNLTVNAASGDTEGDLWYYVTGGTMNSIGGTSGQTYVVVNNTWTPMGYYDNNNQIFLPQTVNNYSGTRQVLSTGFHFYFGLRPGQSSYNKLIKYYGPKGAFPPVN